jgi:hypothetical protein
LKEIGLGQGALAEVPEAEPSESWFANLLWFERKKCVLFTHGTTLFSFFARGLQRAQLRRLPDLFIEMLVRELAAEGLPAETFGAPSPEHLVLARTNNRQVLGCMNDLTVGIEHTVHSARGLAHVDMGELNHRLRRTILTPLYALGVRYPIDATRDFMNKEPGGSSLQIPRVLPASPVAQHSSVLGKEVGPNPKKQLPLVLRIKVELKDIPLPVWRRIEVPASYSFWDLHVAIQDAMGWEDRHLHLFRITNPKTGHVDEIGIPDPDGFVDDPVCLAGWETPLKAYLRNVGDHAEYEYDFGDSWIHEMSVEAIGERAERTKCPRCLAGEGACPPEDCGGTSGYANLMEIMAQRNHPERESWRVWLGRPFDPDWFDAEQVRFDNPRTRWKIAFAEED